jgi:hypothetical protein
VSPPGGHSRRGADHPRVAAYLVNTYCRDKERAFAGSHPRDLVDQIIGSSTLEIATDLPALNTDSAWLPFCCNPGVLTIKREPDQVAQTCPIRSLIFHAPA